MNGAVAADWGGKSVSPVTMAESVEVLGQGGDRMGLPVNIWGNSEGGDGPPLRNKGD